MKCVKITIAAMFLACSLGSAADYIRIDVDSIPTNSQSVVMDFYMLRECPQPAALTGMMNGFALTATGDATWELMNVVPSDAPWMWYCPGGILFTDMIIFPPPDSFCVGFACLPPGMPVFTTEERYFSLIFNMGSGEGEMCIDSAFVPPNCAWVWSGLTCGLGGAPDRPLFLDKYGSDENHPICITIYTPPEYRGDADGNGQIDIDDIVYLVAFVFSGGPAPNPMENGDVDCTGGVDIDDIVYLVAHIFSEGPSPCAPGEPTVISGTIVWPGHELIHPYAIVDTSHTSTVCIMEIVAADAEGNFTIQLDLDAPLEARIDGWDDLNDNYSPDSGERFGWWDVNGNYQFDDRVVFLPGQVVTGVIVEMMGEIASPGEPGSMVVRTLR